MSIFYGYIDLDKQIAEESILKSMASKLLGYKYDSHSTLVNRNVAMGFLNQYVTCESKFDELPYYNKDNGLYFVCDAILDNRDELIGLLGLESKVNLSDSQIVFESYRKWKKDCAKYLLGDFAFVVYDVIIHKVILFRDHIGKRLIYYKVENNKLFFSTLIKPLVDPFDINLKNHLNEQYFVEFLSIEGVRQEITPGITVYRGINYILPGSYLTISNNSILNKIYWDPREIKVDSRLYKTDYIEEFRKVFYEAVKCRLRTCGDIGVFLSGGLDSSSVACVAASLLDEQKKSLNTYTSVPIAGFTNWAPAYNIVDESKLVNKMKDSYPNMNTHFVDSKGKDSLSIISRMLDIFEQPYKFVDNSYWLNDIYQIASIDGCKIILTGSFGNATISFGSLDTHFFEHAMKMHYIRFIKDLKSACLHNDINSKKMLGYLFKEISKVIFGKEKYHSKLVNNDYQKIYNVNKKMHSVGLTSKPFHRFRTEQMMFFHPSVTNHYAASMTKFGLANNICERDPTSDKRVVEYCLRLPYDCFFYEEKGLDRGLIRQAMQGVVPPLILDIFKYKGLQGADWLERINHRWKDFLVAHVEELTNKSVIYKYINEDYFRRLVDDNNELTYSYEVISAVREILEVYICNKYIDML